MEVGGVKYVRLENIVHAEISSLTGLGKSIVTATRAVRAEKVFCSPVGNRSTNNL